MPEKKNAVRRTVEAILKTDIVKYPNRRLYADSSYITQRDVFDRAKAKPVRVVAKKTHEDITGRTILQAICELEERGEVQIDTAAARAFLLKCVPAAKVTAAAA